MVQAIHTLQAVILTKARQDRSSHPHPQSRHSGEGRNPAVDASSWTPAFAGVTEWGVGVSCA